MFIDVRYEYTRCQALVKDSKSPPEFRFSSRHNKSQDLVALDFLNAEVPLQSFHKNILKA